MLGRRKPGRPKDKPGKYLNALTAIAELVCEERKTPREAAQQVAEGAIRHDLYRKPVGWWTLYRHYRDQRKELEIEAMRNLCGRLPGEMPPDAWQSQVERVERLIASDERVRLIARDIAQTSEGLRPGDPIRLWRSEELEELLNRVRQLE